MRIAWNAAMPRRKLGGLALEQECLDALLYYFVALIQHLQLALHHASLRIGCLALLEHFDSRVDCVARLDRLRELQVVEPQKCDQCVVLKVKLEQQTRRNRVNERTVRDAPSELRLFAKLFVDVQRIVVARQSRK